MNDASAQQVGIDKMLAALEEIDHRLDIPLIRQPRPPTPPAPPPNGGNGESPHNGGMEARVAKLEAAMEFVQRDLGDIKTDIREIKRDARGDFRLLFGALITVALGLAGMMAKGFGWV